MPEDRFNVTCPCCSTRLVVDAGSGEILSEDRPRPDLARTFDQALTEVQTGEQRRQDVFRKAFDRTQNLDELLSKKFDEAKRKAAETPGTKPRSPFDTD